MHTIKSAQGQKILQEIHSFLDEMVEIRHDLHAHPELAYEEHRTSALVAQALESYGYKVTRGLGKTGVVGQLHCGTSTKTIGLRADFDALPIEECTNLPYRSQNPGKMHACGHDGHTAMLLTAARYLAKTKIFNGTLNVIFQPAEEGFAGAKAMIEDGLFEKFPCEAVFGIHNLPGSPVGATTVRPGPFMPSSDTVRILIKGKGGHGAAPHLSRDPVVMAASTVMALQSVVARNISPLENAVISVGKIQAGTVSNVIPDEAELLLTVRSFSKETRTLLQERIEVLVTQQVKSFGGEAEIDYRLCYPVLVNHQKETEFAASVACDVFGSASVNAQADPAFGSEDFAFMLEERPGCYLMLGNGDSAGLHNAHYDFNDALLPLGACYWARLVESYLQ